MIQHVISILLFVFQPGIISSSYVTDDKPGNLNTAADANYLTTFEKELVLEMNKLRTDPSGYAEKYIAPLAKSYKGKILYYPGDKPLKTKEGVSALNECIRDLKRAQPVSLIYPSAGLSRAARDHVDDQSISGRTGHIGGDRSSIKSRAERYGTWYKVIGENIAYGGKYARQVIIYLLIDDGVNGRGHRINMLNPDFKITGIASGKHPVYGSMFVMDFAGSFTEKTR